MEVIYPALWEVGTNRELLEVRNLDSYIAPVLSPDGKIFALDQMQNEIRFWDVQKKRELFAP